MGTAFTVGSQNVSVTALGIYAWGDDSLRGDDTLRLYGSGTTPIASILVTPSTTPASIADASAGGEFFFYTLSQSVTLLAGNSYMVASDTGPSIENYYGSGDATFGTSSDFTGYQGLLTVGDGLEPATDQSEIFLGPNLQYTTAVPEPASFGLFAIGACGMLLRRRSRGKTAGRP
jgi:hypothetical protein